MDHDKADVTTTPSDARIDLMTIDDYDAVLALWRGCDGIGLSDADSRENIGRYLERNPGLSLVARYQDKIVAAMLLGHDGRRGYLHHLAVAEAFRRHGIGRRLVKRALSGLTQLGITKCHLFLYGDNDPARRFWESCGWTVRRDVLLVSCELL